MSKLNITLLKQIRDRINTVPQSYDQTIWCAPSDKAPCGTVACLAGEAIICAAPSVEDGLRDLKRLEKRPGLSVAKKAAELLGLPAPEFFSGGEGNNSTANLFDSVYIGPNRRAVRWPEPFKSRYRQARTYRGRASAAVAYLDHIIETGSVD